MYIHTQTRINCVCECLCARSCSSASGHGNGQIQRVILHVAWTAFWHGNSRRNLIYDILQQNHAWHRSYAQIRPPPFKNVIYTLGVKSISKIWLSRCMGNTKRRFLRNIGSTIFIFSTSAAKHFFCKTSAAGCQKWQSVLLTLRQKQKDICFLQGVGSLFLSFATPLEQYWHYCKDTPGSGRFWSALAGSGRLASCFGTLEGPFDPHEPRQG